MNDHITIRFFNSLDIPVIVKAFALANWTKSVDIFEKYLYEQNNLDRIVWVAYNKEQFAGYVTLKWESLYKPFLKEQIPEIMDLNVLPHFRTQGIASNLLETAENIASTRNNIVGLGVGLYKDYGLAQKLYIKRGYVPDGLGITYNYEHVIAGNTYQIDDDLILWMTKKFNLYYFSTNGIDVL